MGKSLRSQWPAFQGQMSPLNLTMTATQQVPSFTNGARGNPSPPPCSRRSSRMRRLERRGGDRPGARLRSAEVRSRENRGNSRFDCEVPRRSSVGIQAATGRGRLCGWLAEEPDRKGPKEAAEGRGTRKWSLQGCCETMKDVVKGHNMNVLLLLSRMTLKQALFMPYLPKCRHHCLAKLRRWTIHIHHPAPLYPPRRSSIQVAVACLEVIE